MLRAVLNGQDVLTYEHDRQTLKKWASKNLLLCPACGRPYEYCHGKIIQPYFRHKDKCQCVDRYSEPETEEHLQGKRDLYKWIKKQSDVTDVILEGYIKSTHQRPDIMFKYHDEQYVIEYQCSPIASEYFERHELYQTAGINDIWICGTLKYFQHYHKKGGEKRLNTVEAYAKLYYDPINKCFFDICELEKKFFYKILNNKTHMHLMRTPYDYRPCEINFYQVKSVHCSESSYTRYPSPTGRRSNKYPYPVTEYEYSSNHSIAKCLKLNNICLRGINNGRH